MVVSIGFDFRLMSLKPYKSSDGLVRVADHRVQLLLKKNTFPKASVILIGPLLETPPWLPALRDYAALCGAQVRVVADWAEAVNVLAELFGAVASAPGTESVQTIQRRPVFSEEFGREVQLVEAAMRGRDFRNSAGFDAGPGSSLGRASRTTFVGQRPTNSTTRD